VSDLLRELSQLVTPAFAISTMLGMGMGLTVAQIAAPLRNVRFIVAALGLNFVLVPVAAWLIGTVAGLDQDLRIGLILVASVAGAPMIPKLVTIAKGDGATAVALVTLLVVATVVVGPLALPLLLPGVTVDPGAIAFALAWQMLLPLGVGVFVRERYPDEAEGYRGEVASISNLSLLLLILTSAGQNLPGVLGLFGSGAILATVVLIAAAIAGGYLLAIPAGVERRLLALGAGQRNLAAAFIIAAGSFADRPTVLAFLAAAGVVMMVVLFPVAGEWSKRPSRLRADTRLDEDDASLGEA
jgi:BASS family bile acid:Na+ symporter